VLNLYLLVVGSTEIFSPRGSRSVSFSTSCMIFPYGEGVCTIFFPHYVYTRSSAFREEGIPGNISVALRNNSLRSFLSCSESAVLIIVHQALESFPLVLFLSNSDSFHSLTSFFTCGRKSPSSRLFSRVNLLIGLDVIIPPSLLRTFP